ncbi:cell division protein FtsA [Providencia rettgeri]|uniref:Cell division protein FtsA n=1 Tax=Providencia rettgeri TaxID=587 RepID=A0A379FQ41_PRORE|nr:cell division protein FtsA [Providencia rettgeri]
MIKATDRKLVVGLEIGTSKVSALVGEILPDGMVNIIGGGELSISWNGQRWRKRP